VFSYYRFLGTDRRWGTMGWQMTKTAERTSDGAVQVTWPAQPEQPFELSATYKWVQPNALNVETAVEAKRDLPNFEVFIGSYFARPPAAGCTLTRALYQDGAGACRR